MYFCYCGYFTILVFIGEFITLAKIRFYFVVFIFIVTGLY